MASPQQNPVGFLMEFVQKHNVGRFPTYTEVGAVGQDHCKTFTVKCEFLNCEVSASSSVKKAAKTAAAREMVEMLSEQNFFAKYNLDEANLLKPKNKANSPIQVKSPISRLQEHCQRGGLALPIYDETNANGAGFKCLCKFGADVMEGNGTTKKSAKEESAFNMCVKLGLVEAGVRRGISKAENLYPAKNNSSDENATAGANLKSAVKNPITALQELCQRNGKPMPIYVEKGMLFDQFTVECVVGAVRGVGRDSNKKGAKTLAAYDCLRVVMQSMPAYIAGLKDPESDDTLDAAIEALYLGSDKPDLLKEWVEPTKPNEEKKDGKLAANGPATLKEWVEPTKPNEEEKGGELAANGLATLKECVEPKPNGEQDGQKLLRLWPEDSVVEVEPRSDELVARAKTALTDDPDPKGNVQEPKKDGLLENSCPISPLDSRNGVSS